MDSKSLIVALALLGSVSADFTNVSHLGTTTIAFGSAASHDSEYCYFAGSDGGVSGVFVSQDSGATLDYTPVSPGPLISMTVAADDNSNVLAAGLFGAIASSDDGASFTKLTLPNVMIAAQDVKYDHDRWTMTGQFVADESDGIMTSTDMNEWTYIPVTGLYSQGALRYSNMPSDQVVYATAGFWNDTASTGITRQLTSTLAVQHSGRPVLSNAPKDSSDLGWWAQVVKSSDAGATWEVVFESIDEGYYPNDIHCFDETNCMFVMEGMYSPKAMHTTDGGKTWTTALTDSQSVSLMSVKMISDSEAWVAGGGDVGRMWHTTDMTNWEASTTTISDAASFTSFVVDAANSVIYATGVLRSQLCSMLRMTF